MCVYFVYAKCDLDLLLKAFDLQWFMIKQTIDTNMNTAAYLRVNRAFCYSTTGRIQTANLSYMSFGS